MRRCIPYPRPEIYTARSKVLWAFPEPEKLRLTCCKTEKKWLLSDTVVIVNQKELCSGFKLFEKY